MSKKVHFKFNDKNEVMNVINTGGSLVGLLAKENNGICPLIGTKIKLEKLLGKGSYGKIFLIECPGMGEISYAVKKVSVGKMTSEFISTNTITLKDYAKEYSKKYLIDEDIFIEVNGGNGDKIIKGLSEIFIPRYAEICKLESNLKVKRFDGNGYTIIPKGNYLCDEPQYSEYVISLLVGDLFRLGKSINFIDVFEFASCNETKSSHQKNTYQYTFMQKIDDTLYNIEDLVFEKDSKTKNFDRLIPVVVLIQIYHAISVYQEIYKIVHGDLHDKNIFIKIITEKTKFNEEKLIDADWFHYKINKVDLYLPAIKYIVKIGDWGLSVKWSKPIVGDKEVIKTGYNQFDGTGEWLPNWYAESYDSTFITNIFANHNPDNKIISDIYKFMTKITKKPIRGDGGDYKRPILKELESGLKHFTPENILTNKELFGEFMVKPKTGKIITLGVI